MLQGKIDKNGFLFIDRGLPELTRAMCPHTQKACSHDCALFGVPSTLLTGVTTLYLCGNELWFSELIDERGAA